MPAVVDHIISAVGKLLPQFRGKKRIEGFLAANVAELNRIELALQQTLTITSIEDSEGEQLDNLGRMFDIARGTKDDDTYKLFLQARLTALRSSGTVEQLYAPIKITDPTALFWIDPHYPAKIQFSFISPPLSADDADQRIQLLRDAKMGGVGVYFYWWPTTGPGVFSFAGDPSDELWGDEVWGDGVWGGADDDNGFSDALGETGGQLAGVRFF